MKKLKIILAVVVAALLANGLLLFQSGLWRKAVSDDHVWEKIRKNGSYAAYLEAATEYFGSREKAENTDVDWAVDRWKSKAGSAVLRQKFLTGGVVFELENGRAGWRVVAVKSNSE